MRIPLVASCLALAAFLSCTEPTRYDAGSAVPLAPTLLRIELTTHNDAEPCLRLRFDNPNSPPSTLVLERERQGGGFEILRRGIPADLRILDDLDYPVALTAEYVRYRYRLYAVSIEDSASPRSNIDSVFLLRDAPRIDSVTLTYGYPTVYYYVNGLQGVRCTLEVVKRDSVLAGRIDPETFNEGPVSWGCVELPLDTLRAVSGRIPSDDGFFGVRLRAATGGLRRLSGISVKRFALPGSVR